MIQSNLIRHQRQQQQRISKGALVPLPPPQQPKKPTKNNNPFLHQNMNESQPTPTLTNNEPINLSSTASDVFLVLTIIIAVLGNTLVCLACVISKRLKSFTEPFIISLAVTDILVGLISMPIWLSNSLTGKPNIRDFPTIYKLWLQFDIVCCTASIMNLVFISVDRFIAVTYPLRYPSIVTRNRVAIGIAFIWLYSLIIALIKLQRWRYYSLFVSLASFFVPLLIMLFAYSRIFHVALTHVRSIRRIHSDQSISNRRTIENFHVNLKAARTFSIVIGAFVVCWCPFFVVTLLAVYSKASINNNVLAMIKWLTYGNSALNPLIYSCLNKNFRAAFTDVFRRALSRRMTHAQSSTKRHPTTSVVPQGD